MASAPVAAVYPLLGIWHLTRSVSKASLKSLLVTAFKSILVAGATAAVVLRFSLSLLDRLLAQSSLLHAYPSFRFWIVLLGILAQAGILANYIFGREKERRARRGGEQLLAGIPRREQKRVAPRKAAAENSLTSTWVKRAAMMPLFAIPIAGPIGYALLHSNEIGQQYLDGYARTHDVTIDEQSKRAFGITAGLLDAVPLAGVILHFSNYLGAALFVKRRFQENRPKKEE